MQPGNGLENKQVVILGGSSGIGLAVAEQAASQGAKIVIASSNAERVQKAVESIGGNAQGQAVDLSDEKAVEAFFAKLGAFDQLVFTAGEYIDGTARQAGNVLIISFKQPLDVAVNRVAEQAPDYIGAARRDPDGTAVRMALAQNVTIHAMSAGEKFFVDLLPTSWSGMPPGLPQDVVDELARRAREAERLLARQRTAVQEKTSPPIRVHVASQPTFTRYVFAVPGETGVKK